MLQQAVAEGVLDFNDSASDPTREKLVDSFLDPIAKDTPSEKVRMELNCLGNIYSCKRKHGESFSSFISRFKGCVVRFAIRSPDLNEGGRRYFGMLLTQNLKLSPDTSNYVTFQISSNMDAVLYSLHKVRILKLDAERILTDSTLYSNIYCSERRNQINEAMDRIASKNASTLRTRTVYCFGLKHVAEIVAQLKFEYTPSTGIEAVYGRGQVCWIDA